MTIDLKPETEALIRQGLESGSYRNAADFVEQAVNMLYEQEAWLAENRSAISHKIEEGYTSAQRGELTDGDQVRARMDARKQEWLAQQQRNDA